MPVEVREIVIKGIITDGADAANTSGGSNSNTPNSGEIVKACVEMVLAILKEKTER
jgi:hypothetical protein